jgi:hypothetical protein
MIAQLGANPLQNGQHRRVLEARHTEVPGEPADEDPASDEWNEALISPNQVKPKPKKKPKPKLQNKAQSERFIEAAQILGIEETGDRFEESLAKILGRKCEHSTA